MISNYQKKRIENLELDTIEGGGIRYYFDFKNNDNKVILNLKDDRFSCSCWRFANRTIVNPDKYGYCCHILKVVKEIVEAKN